MDGVKLLQVSEKWVVRLQTIAGANQDFVCPTEGVARAFVARLAGRSSNAKNVLR